MVSCRFSPTNQPPGPARDSRRFTAGGGGPPQPGESAPCLGGVRLSLGGWLIFIEGFFDITRGCENDVDHIS